MSTETENKEKEKAFLKRKKDQFSVTIVGIVIYSVVLIGIVAGTYLGVKTFLKNHEKEVEAAVAMAEEDAEKKHATQEKELIKEEEVPTQAPEQEKVEEENLPEKLLDVTSLLDSETYRIDYEQVVAEPEKRDGSLKWNDTIFSKLENVQNPAEALVNTYDFSRKYALTNTDKRMEFQIYSNPETQKAEKITTKEYCGDDVEVTNYYYQNGRINYISQYRQAVDMPINPSTTDVQSRYYFSYDTLVKYLFCENGQATQYTSAEVDSYSEGTVEQFDFMEKNMLNKAYINYNVVKLLPESQKVEGYVMDEFNSVLGDVNIHVSNKDESTQFDVTTSPDGYYSFELPVEETTEYKLRFSKQTMDTVTIDHVWAVKGANTYDVEPVYLAYSETGAVYNVQIVVKDASNAINGLADAQITLRAGINNYDGDVIAAGVLDETGAITAPMKAGCYTAEVQKGGYEDCYFTIIVKADHQAVLGYAVPDVGPDEFVTILSWDSTPLDEDLRIFSGNGIRVIKSPIDSVGSTIAEMVKVSPVGNDVFECYVSDYSNCTGGDYMSYSMSGSNAYVSVYSADGLMTQMHIPLAHAGVVWKPFEVRGERVIPMNDFYYHVNADSIWMNKQ